MHGFTNIGNTCYFNSVIQNLLHIHDISAHILDNKYTGDCKFTQAYENLIHIYFKTKETKIFTVEPVLQEFVKVFPRFRIGEPHDAQDAFFCIIDILERSYPYIKEIVYGETKQITISPIGKNIIKNPFCIHILNMKRDVKDVNTMIKESHKWNTLENYIDERGKKHHVATTRILFSKYPKIFFISFDKKSFVNIEEELVIEKNVYVLKSTIIHKGIQYGGHYMSTIKMGEDWLIQDDDTLGKLHNFPKQDNHFILVYNLKTPSSEYPP
tara:strand:+ start:1483 stop:2289 length:807 start_codon:yes stop_codon:yes gene_type:complete